MNKSQLLPLLKEASKYSPKKKRSGLTSVPILACAKITSINNNLKVEVTDLEKYFIGTIKTDLPDMEFLIDIRWFRDIVNVMDKNCDIDFGLSDNSFALIVKQRRTKFNLKIGTNLDDFPLNPSTNELKFTMKNIEGKNFTGMLYTYVNEDDYQNPYEIHKDKKKELNKIFPKYLKINGSIAIKIGISYDFFKKKDNPNSYEYKYYGDYDLSYGSNIQDDIKRISINDIKDYEVVGKKTK